MKTIQADICKLDREDAFSDYYAAHGGPAVDCVDVES